MPGSIGSNPIACASTLYLEKESTEGRDEDKSKDISLWENKTT